MFVCLFKCSVHMIFSQTEPVSLRCIFWKQGSCHLHSSQEEIRTGLGGLSQKHDYLQDTKGTEWWVSAEQPLDGLQVSLRVTQGSCSLTHHTNVMSSNILSITKLSFHHPMSIYLKNKHFLILPDSSTSSAEA